MADVFLFDYIFWLALGAFVIFMQYISKIGQLSEMLRFTQTTLKIRHSITV